MPTILKFGRQLKTEYKVLLSNEEKEKKKEKKSYIKLKMMDII